MPVFRNTYKYIKGNNQCWIAIYIVISFSYQYESDSLNIDDDFSIKYFLIQFTLMGGRCQGKQHSEHCCSSYEKVKPEAVRIIK